MDPYPSTVLNALRQLYEKVITYLPNLIVAAIVLIIGWLLASLLSKAVQKVLDVIQIDKFANQLGLRELSERTGKQLSLARFGAWVVKWFFFLGSFVAAANILGLDQVTTFLYQDVLSYAGRVILAVATLMLGILAANFFGGLVSGTVRASGMAKSQLLGSLTKWAILVFAFITALSEVLPAGSVFLQDLFRAVVAMLAIAGGIAFGIGGKEHAKRALDAIEEDLSGK